MKPQQSKLTIFFATFLFLRTGNCGLSAESIGAEVEYDPPVDFAVLGGNFAEQNELKWIVSLHYPDQNGDLKHFCGGSIISKRLILTAAHCLFDPKTNDRIDQSKLRIKGGNISPHNTAAIEVDYIVIHPNFSNLRGDRFLQNDIAILRLPKNLRFNNKVGKIDLPSPNEFVNTSSTFYVAGWGFTERKKDRDEQEYRTVSPYLQRAPVTFISNVQCSAKLEQFKVTESMLCTNSTATDICQGDSGGPLYKKYFLSNPVTGKPEMKHKLIGIISGASNGCGKPNGVSVFTKVANYMNRLILGAIRQCGDDQSCLR